MELYRRIFQNSLFHITVLSALTIITFLPVLKMFFYTDDFAYLYKLSQGETIEFPYQYSVYFIKPFYLLFGLNPTPYFATGLVLVALSVVVFYLFVLKLLKSKNLALVTGLIYATSPIGVDRVFQVCTFINGYIITIMMLVLLYLLLDYFQRRKLYIYILCVLLFALFLELKPMRVFLFVPVIFLFDYLTHFKKLIPSMSLIKRQLPFIVIFAVYYLIRLFINKSSSSMYNFEDKPHSILTSNFYSEPFIALANILAGSPLVFLTEYEVSIDTLKYPFFWTVLVLIIAFALVAVAWKTKKEWGLLLLFSLGWIYSIILGFYFFSSPGISETTARVIALSAPAKAIFLTLAGLSVQKYITKKRNKKTISKIFILIIIAFISVNFLATRFHLNRFNDLRSKHAHVFFKELKELRPQIPPNSFILIQPIDEPYIRSRLYNMYKEGFYGGQGTMAVFYGLKWDEVTLSNDYIDAAKFAGQDASKIKRIFAFSYDDDGLHDITDRIRLQLADEKDKNSPFYNL